MTNTTYKNLHAADPQEVPPANPVKPSTPPLGVPPSGPGPDIPAPAREPAEPQQPAELPGQTPDEMPSGGPMQTPRPLTDAATNR